MDIYKNKIGRLEDKLNKEFEEKCKSAEFMADEYPLTFTQKKVIDEAFSRVERFNSNSLCNAIEQITDEKYMSKKKKNAMLERMKMSEVETRASLVDQYFFETFKKNRRGLLNNED